MAITDDERTIIIDHMRRAARIALRANGDAEPNPMVGCVVLDRSGGIVAEARTARCGGPHAERAALGSAGPLARGGTLLTTLEPCCHHGRTPPCTDAIIEAGIERVIFGTVDPNPVAAGGARVLVEAGIRVDHLPIPETDDLNAPFLHRLSTGLPWMVAKWAQTIDGRIATSNGRSRWISSPRSRRLVHRVRGRVDAVLTGIGTVLADDPRLTPRDAVHPRRHPERIVVDENLKTPLGAALVTSAGETPTTILCRPERLESNDADALRAAGVLLRPLANDEELRECLRALSAERGYGTILVESGGGLLGRLLAQNLINDALVFIAPLLLGDQEAPGSVRGHSPESIAEAARLRPLAVLPRRDDIVAWYRLDEPAADLSSD